MISRERVRAALEHKEADMMPIDFGAMRSTGISAIAYNKLKEYLNIKSGHTKLYDVFQQLAEPELEVLKIMGGDVIQLHRMEPAFGLDIRQWKHGKLPDGSKCIVPYNFNPVKNQKGDLEIKNGDTVIARMPEGGIYFDYVNHQLQDAKDKNDLDKFDIPVISDEELEFLKKEGKRLYEETDYAILGAFGGNIFETGQIDWGYEKYFTELAINPNLVHYYHQKLTESYMESLKRYLNAVGKYIDVIQFGDDLGTQENTQISVEMYKKLIKPYHKKQFEYVRNNFSNVKVFFHSCGSIYDMIPDLIDAGVEVLNPIQLSAKKMDPLKLKKEFGKDLVFWGGGVDTQTTVTSGTIEDIKSEVKKLINVFAPGGGYVFNQVHNILANISPEKIMAIYNTANEYRNYPIEV